jgi:hypothetical protein
MSATKVGAQKNDPSEALKTAKLHENECGVCHLLSNKANGCI